MSSSLNQSQQSTSQCFGWSANHGVCRPYMLAPASGYRLWQLVLTLRFKLLKGTKINTGKRKCPFLPAQRYASAGYRDRNVSVRPSVCHAPVLCQNEES